MKQMRPHLLPVIALILTSCVLVPTLSPHAVTPSATDVPAGQMRPAPAHLPPSPSNTTSPAIGPGEYGDSMVFGGETRSYILHVPPQYDGSKPVPLVVMLHPYGGSNSGFEQSSDMDLKADQQGFIVVYPLGTGEPYAWNALFFPARPSPPDDVGFLTALIDKLEAEFRIDLQRVYAGGFSNGGMMSDVLGAVLSDRLAAIAVVSGTVGVRQADGTARTIPDPALPVSVVVFHGKGDQVVPYDGGVAFLGFDFLSVQDSIGFWAKHDGCSAPPQTTTGQNGNIQETDYASCKAGSEVLLVTIRNGGHDWPTVDRPNQVSATDMIWDFFSRHSRP